MSLNVLFKSQQPNTKSNSPSELSFGGARIPRDLFTALSTADALLREAEAAAAELLRQASAAAETQKQQGHAQGFLQGRKDAMVAVLGSLEFERQLRELLSHRLANIVERCLRDILGDLGDAIQMRQRVLHLLRTSVPATHADSTASPEPGTKPLPLSGSATLYVSPRQLALARDAVASLKTSDQGSVAGLVVVADERRMPDVLLLETQLGFIESNLELTLQETRNLVQQAAARAITALGGAA